MNIFTATGQILNSYVAVITATARATEKGVKLVENEIDLLEERQNVHISNTRAELAAQLPHKPSEKP